MAGAGAGIGGNGGNGGAASKGTTAQSGEEGENAGTINIYDTVSVYAYGGGAGAGGDSTPYFGSGGGGGRRRLSSSWNRSVVELEAGGGNTEGSGGGFCSGGVEPTSGSSSFAGGENGLSGSTPTYRCSSGSYFQLGTYGSNKTYSISTAGLVGGTGAAAANQSFKGGDGGTGGSGGSVAIHGNISRIHAYNGAYITDSGATIDQTDTWKQENQSIIYAQVGYSLVDLRDDLDSETSYPVISEISSRTATDLITELGDSYRSIDYSVYTTYGAMGIGSGGGCIEVSNGTLTVSD